MDSLVALAGLVLLLFVPGYYLSCLLQPTLDVAARLLLTIGLSLAIDVALGTALGLSGCFRVQTLWAALGGVSGLLFSAHWLVHRKLV